MANTLKFGNGQWATKVGSTLAYNDEGGNFKPLPFNFTRSTSATRVNKDGLIEVVTNNKPRIDFLNDSNGALLLEPQRTNSLLYSNEFTYVGWSKASAGTGSTPVVTGNYAVSPDGSQNADRLQLNKGSGTTSSDYSFLYETVTSVGTGSISIWMKSNDSSTYKVALRVLNYVVCDVTPEWQRFELNNQASTNEIQVMLRGTYGTSDSADILIYGAQLEKGSYATSYIPTQGSIGTRTVEYSKILNQPILKATNKFTMFFDAPKFLEINGGVGSFDSIMLNLGAAESAYDGGGGLHIYNNFWYYFDGSVATDIGICYNSLTDSKFAISYDGTSFHKYANGVKIGSIALSASMVNWDTFQTGAMADAGLDERSWNLKNLKLYNTALTDQELINLTTI